MFKWKVSGLGGGGSKKEKNAINKLNNAQLQETEHIKNNKNKEQNKKDAKKNVDKDKTDNQSSSPSKTGLQRFFHGSKDSSNKIYDTKDAVMSRVGQRLAMNNNGPLPAHNDSAMNNFINRHHQSNGGFNHHQQVNHPPVNHQQVNQRPPHIESGETTDQSALPSDSLYGYQEVKSGSHRERQFGSRPSLNGLAHWSSHGYLAKSETPKSPDPSSGYVVLKRQGDQMVTVRGGGDQPQSLPPMQQPPFQDQRDKKYFSVRGMMDVRQHMQQQQQSAPNEQSKYYSLDARYNSIKALPPDLRQKLQAELMRGKETATNPYQPLPKSPQQRGGGEPYYSQIKRNSSNLESAKHMSNSVSWLEWTQQLQAYIAWVNSQLRKRPDLRPVADLRSDLQSGEVLAQLIEIISGEKIVGIQYKPESLQGMRENLERILQFMASKRIRMHHITSKEVLEGNLKAIMRLILALAAHYKPQSVRHHDAPGVEPTMATPHDTTQPIVDFNPDETRSSVLDRSADHSSTADQTVISTNATAATATFSSNTLPSSLQKQEKKPDETQQIYENVSAAETTNEMQTQTEVKATIQREGSFVRTGSGRKLPKIPTKPLGPRSYTLPPQALSGIQKMEELEKEEAETKAVDKDLNRKSRPKALEFWESIETTGTDKMADFRYNTIHRMSMGRRMLPKPPMEGPRSQSLDRGGEESLNSSFSGPTSLPVSASGSTKREASPAAHVAKFPPDGCSLQSDPSDHQRGEVEGSSDNNSPPTSVFQDWSKRDPTTDWVRGQFGKGSKRWTKPGKEFLNHHDELSSEKYLPKYAVSNLSTDLDEDTGDSDNAAIPYEVLLQDLTQAKRQLLELHTLNISSKDPSTADHPSSDDDNPVLDRLKQNLLRTTLAKQTLEYERKELLKRIDELERDVQEAKSEKTEEAVKKLTEQDPDLKSLYEEELAVARDAICNLRTSFNVADPNQHILDTLEQCISVIVEKISCLDHVKEGQDSGLKKAVTPAAASSTTKVLYFTNRSGTPFMSTIHKSIGDVTLRDFKTLFDRPGFFRYHFKTVDQEFGMVKEEITSDDQVLPGADGKIVAWVEED